MNTVMAPADADSRNSSSWPIIFMPFLAFCKGKLEDSLKYNYCHLEYGGVRLVVGFLQNVGTYIPKYTASHFRRQIFKQLPWVLRIPG
jgi:hypothetical protein